MSSRFIAVSHCFTPSVLQWEAALNAEFAVTVKQTSSSTVMRTLRCGQVQQGLINSAATEQTPTWRMPVILTLGQAQPPDAWCLLNIAVMLKGC